MLKQRVGTRAMQAKIDALWRKYPRGLVAYLEEGKVPAGGEGLAYYLAKYVVSPPISLRRILRYDGQRVRYWYNDHTTKQRQEEEISALTFIGRMVQHMLPKALHLTSDNSKKLAGRPSKRPYYYMEKNPWVRFAETLSQTPGPFSFRIQYR
jgi:hypothetical protein